MTESDSMDRLRSRLRDIGELAVAVSGGVDSMTLAFLAHDVAKVRMTAFHAVSPAVPPEATARVRRHASRHGWRLRVVDAGEFRDSHYLSNPVNRCYFCKTNLYQMIARATAALPVVSGANLDDLGDFRPGLKAASEWGVRHPFVEAGIDKATVRAFARHCGLDDLAELPAMPCLSSRIETGLRIDSQALRMVHRIETLVRENLPEARDVRCRVRAAEITIEIDDEVLAAMPRSGKKALHSEVATFASSLMPEKPVRFARYVRGSAFVR